MKIRLKHFIKNTFLQTTLVRQEIFVIFFMTSPYYYLVDEKVICRLLCSKKSSRIKDIGYSIGVTL